MRIYILGICGTFMGGLALLAKQMGFEVQGCDENVYPPMSDVLHQAGIEIHQGFDPAFLNPPPDQIIVGNTMKRGNPLIEHMLNKGLRYCSGPQWIAEQILTNRHVIAVSGTHGKTTTTSLITWILTYAKLNPGYLIGGAPQNFQHTANLGESPYFVIEADEYDCAFFDKRSKFIHYHPRTLIINNIEYDHADIFPDLESIKRQFQFLLRTVPACGTIIHPHHDAEIQDVLSRGCWSSAVSFGLTQGLWQAHAISNDGSRFEVWHRDQKLGIVEWSLVGHHNVHNALAAIAAAHDVGITIDVIIAALRGFKGVKRRLEKIAEINGVTIYDDFAHHPTAIAATISGLRSKVGSKRIIAVLQLGSNTMRMGTHRDHMSDSLKEADRILIWKARDVQWDVASLRRELGPRASFHDEVNDIIQKLHEEVKTSDHILIMSNKGFDGIQKRLVEKLSYSTVVETFK